MAGMVTEDQVQAVLNEESAPQQGYQRLIDAANATGGKDNVTALIVTTQKERASSPNRQGLSPPSGEAYPHQ